MPCTNARAQHTFLRGCCSTNVCPCPGGTSFSSDPYCPCNDTVKNRVISYRDQVCNILSGISGTSIIPPTTLNDALGALDWSSIKCGTFQLFVDDSELIGTVVGASSGGSFVTDDPIGDPGIYAVYIGNGYKLPHCAIVTIPPP